MTFSPRHLTCALLTLTCAAPLAAWAHAPTRAFAPQVQHVSREPSPAGIVVEVAAAGDADEVRVCAGRVCRTASVIWTRHQRSGWQVTLPADAPPAVKAAACRDGRCGVPRRA